MAIGNKWLVPSKSHLVLSFDYDPISNKRKTWIVFFFFSSVLPTTSFLESMFPDSPFI